MLDFCRLEIEGDIGANVKKNWSLQKLSILDFQDLKYHLDQIKITLQKLDLQSSTIYQINRNLLRISMDVSDLR